ncbi:tetraspanin-33 isoform X2 [Acipenser ruthenus]|uniref:tetraspanin-33 isoform X2 n=1 Tax=Acipenser ruthenus TaxID=7906 RepID=UPI0027404EAF|nr:tetraspanin-33 isoform X2 [Acipenser ruthenus]
MKTCGGIKYTLFACCYIFWVSSAVLISVGIYAKIAKEGGAVDSLTADPALLLIVVGSFMFIITFFGCFGALRDALNLLNIVLIRTEAVMRRGITTYRDDLDLQNLIDFVQKKFQCCGVSQYTDWSHNVYFNCVDSNPSLERCGVPYSCCIKNNESILNTMCGYGMQSFKAWSIEDKIHLNGCLKKIGTWGRQNLLIIGGITTGLCLLEIFMITLAAVQTYQIKKIREKRRKSTVRKSNPSYKTTVMC